MSFTLFIYSLIFHDNYRISFVHFRNYMVIIFNSLDLFDDFRIIIKCRLTIICNSNIKLENKYLVVKYNLLIDSMFTERASRSETVVDSCGLYFSPLYNNISLKSMIRRINQNFRKRIVWQFRIHRLFIQNSPSPFSLRKKFLLF